MRALLPLLAGCTFGPGTGFVTLTDATLDARLVPGEARDLGDGRILTNEGYAVRIDSAELHLGAVHLEELRGADGVDFDPARPPPGYTLCHGGHCHSETGELVDYVEVEAELAGGAATFVQLATFPVDGPVDLLDPAVVPLLDGELELPLGEITRVAIELEEVRLAGVVETDDGDLPVLVDLVAPTTLSAGADLPIDRDQVARLALGIGLTVDGTLLDDLDLSGGLAVLDPADPAALMLLERLLTTDIVLTVEES